MHSSARPGALRLSGILTSLSLYGPSLNYSLASHVNYQFSDVTTAAIMYLFALAALVAGCRPIMHRLTWSSGRGLTALCLMGILVLWVGIFCSEYVRFTEDLSPYDFKRPAFAVYGIFIFGFIGIFASRSPISFLRGFLMTSAINSLILAILYVLIYDPESELARIGGDAGLIVGVLLGQGVASILVMVYLKWIGRVLGFLLLPMLCGALIMSGTRSAILATVFLFAFYFLFGGFGTRRIVSFFGLSLIAAVLLYFAVDFVPGTTFDRITNFKLEGSEDRWALLSTGLEVFSDNPFGKVTGYSALFPAGIEYSHNTIFQIILEAGILSVFFVLALGFGALRSVVVEWPGAKVLRWFLLYVFCVYLVSFSAGDAYNPQFWFVTTFLAALGFGCNKKEWFTDASMMQPLTEIAYAKAGGV